VSRDRASGDGGEAQGPHPSREQLTRYLEQALSPSELLAVDDHLAGCPACREALLERWSPEPALAAWRQALATSEVKKAPGRFFSRPHRLAGLALAASLLLAVGLALARLGGLGPSGEPARESLVDGGRRIELAADGTLRGLEHLSADRRGRIARALASGRLEVPQTVRELAGQTSSLRGGEPPSDGPEPLGPRATVVASDRPSFRWRPLPGADSYQVTVFDPGYRRLAASGPLGGEQWAPAEPLPRGPVLSWQVAAVVAGREVTAPAPPAPEARFRIATHDELARVEAAARDAAGSRLALAAIYAEAGLLVEAQGELGALAEANPDSEVARRLLGSLRVPGP
jgi:hypothetical protein